MDQEVTNVLVSLFHQQGQFDDCYYQRPSLMMALDYYTCLVEKKIEKIKFHL